MDLVFDDATTAFRDEVRSFLEANVPATPLKSMDTAEGFEEHRQWEHTLADAGYAVVSWPKELGGRDASLLEWVIFEEEYYRSGAPGRVSQNGIFLLAPTLFEHANAEQLARIMPRMARADDIWAQAWSEPESGSDLASLRSSAKKVDGGWLLNGQKTWSSRASYADWGFGLFRSDPDAQRHKGITYFMFDLRSKGVTVRPIDQLDGEPGFAEIFLEDVFVPDDPANPGESGVIGNVNEGWRVAMSTASNERGLSLRSPGRFLATVDRLLELYKSSGRTDDSALRNQVADAWIGARATSSTHSVPSPVSPTVDNSAPSPRSTRSSGPSGISPPTRLLSNCRALKPSWPTTGWTDTCSPCPDRSTQAPTRFRKTSSLSVCSAYRRRTDEIRARLLPPGLRCKHRCTADQVRHALRHPFVERR